MRRVVEILTGLNPVPDYKIKINNMCCENTSYQKEDINGECPDCGEPTVDGNAYDCCAYSPTMCKTCGWSPCDESC